MSDCLARDHARFAGTTAINALALNVRFVVSLEATAIVVKYGDGLPP